MTSPSRPCPLRLLQGDVLRFKNDGAKRKRWFTNSAMSHPAKGHIAMWEEMVLRYSKEGDTVLDPMAGIGTTLVAALMGRNVVCVEKEAHFVAPMRQSWEKMQQSPLLGESIGTVLILQGDVRALPLVSADCIITSPLFQNVTQSTDADFLDKLEVRRNGSRFQGGNRTGYTRPQVDVVVTSPPWADEREGAGIRAPGHPDGERKGLTQWGYTRPQVDVVLTSPPWEDKTALRDSKWLHEHEVELAERFRQAHVGEKGLPGNTKPENRSTMEGYTRPQVDAILTSPPFQDQEPFSDKKFMLDNRKGHNAPYGQVLPVGQSRPSPTAYSAGDSDNIGNLRGPAYWAAMAQVYDEAFRVLKPGGLMALVLKGFTRDGVYQDLPGQTEILLLEAGWLKHDHWQRQLWSLSFWRILQATDKEEKVIATTRGMFDMDIKEIKRMKRVNNGKLDERLRFEEVLCFRKPLGHDTRQEKP